MITHESIPYAEIGGIKTYPNGHGFNEIVASSV